MLEYFTYKKVKKHQAEKKAAASQPQTPQLQPQPQTQVRTPSPAGPRPLLNDEDVNFLERIVSAEGPAPPLPDRPQGWVPGAGIEAGDATGNEAQMVVHDGNGTTENHHWYNKGPLKGKEKAKENEGATPITAEKKPNRFSFIARTLTKKVYHLNISLLHSTTNKPQNKDGLHPAPVVTPTEALSEEDDINRVLEDLNLSAVNNRAFSLSKESQQLVQQFTVILKDLINGVPTAYDDLTHLLDDKQGTLSKSYESLPSFLKKLITQLPDKLKNNLAPELLAVASEATALGGKAGTAGATSFSGAAKSFLTPTSLKDLVTKPGAIVSMLKAIMNALKLRWPAFMGTNVLLSLGLFGKLPKF